MTRVCLRLVTVKAQYQKIVHRAAINAGAYGN